MRLLLLAAAAALVLYVVWWSSATVQARKRISAALVASGLTCGDGEPPRLSLTSRRDGPGWLLVVDTPRGQGDAAVTSRAPVLAAELRAYSVTHSPAHSRPGRPAFVVLTDDPLESVPAAPRQPAKKLRAVDIGTTEDGGCADVCIDAAPVLVAGSTGSGKSSASHSLILAAAMSSAALVLVDLKPAALEVHAYKDIAEHIAATPEEALAAFRAVWAFIEARNAALAAEGLKSAAAPTWRRVFVYVDEAAELPASGPVGAEAFALLTRIVAVGRASGVSVVLVTQKPSSDALGGTTLRDYIEQRVCFRVGNREHAVTALGTLPDGVEPWRIPRSSPGLGYLRTDGGCQRFRAYWLDPDTLAEQIAQARHWRGLMSYPPLLPDPPAPPAPKRQRRRRSTEHDE